MDDRVGEILAQRAKLENGAGVAIFFSILLHATLTALAGWSAWHHSSTDSTSTMTIRFAQPAAAPEITPAVQPAPVPAPAVDVPVGGSGVTQLEGGDFPYPLYIQRMTTLIGGHWMRPAVADSTSATVYFVIDRDGTIRDAKIMESSGNGLYDRASLRAVLEVSPLPPLPFGYNGTYLGVGLKFR